MLPINKNRVKNLLAGLARFTTSKEGVTRLAYSKLDKEAQKWLLEQVADLGVSVREDAVGNVFLRREGADSTLAPVACGSHLDTVVNGGAYDGMCGVVGALEALYMLQDENLKRSVEVICFRAEEGSRFGFATIGSKIITGSATPAQMNKSNKKNDITLLEALHEWGCNPANFEEAVKPAGAYASFCEMHIEQGKVLEEKQKQIGIVENIAAPTRFKLHIQGIADHSGATPMGMRKDALLAAAKLIIAVNEAATAEKEYGTVGTVGAIEAEPGVINVVPGKVTLWVDVRGVEEASIARALEAIRLSIKNVVTSDGVVISKELLMSDKPVALSMELAAQTESICQELGYSYMRMNSGAGHDAMNMVKLAPTTMVFIPCKGGVSHSPEEFVSNEEICCGVEVLARILEREANK